MKFGVVIPVFNERDLLPRLIARLDQTPPPTAAGEPMDRLVVVVDDGSTDGTREWIEAELGGRADVRVVLAERNRGKGSALRVGFETALREACDVVLVQDADLEYDPAEHSTAIAPILAGNADAVIGSRFIGQTHRVLYYWHFVANRMITTLSNMLSNLNLTDIECGTKAFTAEVLRGLRLREDAFGIEPEIVAKLARLRLPSEKGGTRAARIYEVPVSYAGRTYAEGKKIDWRDGFSAIRCIVRYNLL